MNFDEIEKLDTLTPEQTEAFEHLKGNKDFRVLQAFIETYLMKKVYALLTGSPVAEGSELDYMKQWRGFARGWKSIISKINYDGPKNKKQAE